MRNQPMQTEAQVGTGYVAWKWVAAMLAAIWISIPLAVVILAGMIALNLIVGLAIAISSGRICSKRGERRITAKVLTLLLTGMVYIVYDFAGRSFGFNLGFHLGTLVAAFYIANEAKAFLEMCQGQGVDIPPILPESLTRLLQRREMTALNLKQSQEREAFQVKYREGLDDRPETGPKR